MNDPGEKPMARVLMISQVFFPDTASVSQHLADLAEDLARKGHEVDVLSSRRAYENPKVAYPATERVRGVRIERLPQTHFTKKHPAGRIMNFVTFNGSLLLRLLMIRKGRYDVMIGTTVPPFLSNIGLFAARIKSIPYFFWAMDLQPELAIAAGYLQEGKAPARFLMKISERVYRKADLIVALDRFMAEHMIRRGAPPRRVKTIPVWPVVSEVYEGNRLANPFRRKLGIGDRIVVMYSGNMAVVHPLDTLLLSAAALKDDERFVFVFIGGGARRKDVAAFKNTSELNNILLLPLQPRDQIHFSLGSADLQVVIHGSRCTGYTHPNKIYGAMYVGKPILYVGPNPSHISEILESLPGNISVRHGDVERLVGELRRFAESGEREWDRIGRKNREYAERHFAPSRLRDRLVQEIEGIS
ncbi:MAG: glycosyltransferase family 4 protein [Candidatus Aminicenantales bacterium]